MSAAKPLQCLNCGHERLDYRQCRIQCANCGFLLDCSDLDTGNEAKQAALHAQRPNAPSIKKVNTKTDSQTR